MGNPLSKIGSKIKGAANQSATFINENASRIQAASNALETQPNYRAAEGTTNRKQQIMTWRLPNGSAVQMYINPQSLEVSESKQINTVRTKGGFVVQYWGSNLTRLSIRGITGSAGVQGINVLRDIYLSENRAFDLVAATQTNEMINALSSQALNTNNIADSLSNIAEDIRERNFILRPSLASLAASVLMFYQGIEYKGFFTDMTVTETAERVGIFEYAMTFMATETRGRRQNVFAWQKEPAPNDMASNLINGVGNAIRGMIGLGNSEPEFFHPESAPYTFGGSASSVGAALGFSSTEQRNILTKGQLF